MKLENLQVYQIANRLAEELWQIVKRWDHFSKDTVGKQLIRSVDSIAANLGEGFGRFHYGENRHFAYYARGSLSETKTWINKARQRDLLTKEEYESFCLELEQLNYKLNNYIKAIGSGQNKQVKEDADEYLLSNNEETL